MSNDIPSLTPAAPAPATAAVRPAAAAGELLALVQAQAVLETGESAPAQVLTLKQAGQAFELLLQLNLSGGRQTLVQATSTQPLLPGTQLTVIQPSAGNLAVLVQQVRSEAQASLTQIDTRQLPIGTLLQGRVLTSQPLEPGLSRSIIVLLNTAQAGATLTLDSPQPLRLGSLLSAQVQGSQALSFVPLSGRLDHLALSQQLAGQQSRQGSLTGLLASLTALQQPAAPADMSGHAPGPRGAVPPGAIAPGPLSTAATLPGLKPEASLLSTQAQATVQTLLDGLPSVAQLADPVRLAQAIQGSGAFMEPSLLAGTLAQQPPDLKSLLLRLVAQLAAPMPANPAHYAAQSALPNAAFSGNPAAVLAQALPGYVRNALGMLGQVSAKTPPPGFPLPSRELPKGEGEGDTEHLLRLASAAISRLQSHQLASLEQTGTNEQGRVQTTWQLEIPMRNLQDIVPLQVKVQREDLPPDDAQPRREPGRDEPPRDPLLDKLWRIELAFDLSPLGPLQVQAQLLRGNLSSELWAERPATALLIERQLGHLRARLRDCGLNVTEINCHHGSPPRGVRTQLEQRWVDETA
jgi:hypothetical protein